MDKYCESGQSRPERVVIVTRGRSFSLFVLELGPRNFNSRSFIFSVQVSSIPNLKASWNFAKRGYGPFLALICDQCNFSNLFNFSYQFVFCAAGSLFVRLPANRSLDSCMCVNFRLREYAPHLHSKSDGKEFPEKSEKSTEKF